MADAIALNPIEIRIGRKVEYDAVLVALGTEARSTHLAKQLRSRPKGRFCFAFPTPHLGSFDRNRAWLEGHDFTIGGGGADRYRAWVRESLSGVNSQQSELRLAIDVSSITRRMMAELILEITHLSIRRRVVADFWYCPAIFERPQLGSPPIEVSGPALPEFAGWSIDPERTLAVLVGLGYEPNLALGTLEYLEPGRVWAFVPRGEDSRYDRAVVKSNSDLLAQLSPDRIVSYAVGEPWQTSMMVDSLVDGLLPQFRVVLVPFGPKVFALCCSLVAAIYQPAVTLWRTSTATFQVPPDRHASGKVYGLRVTVGPSTD